MPPPGGLAIEQAGAGPTSCRSPSRSEYPPAGRNGRDVPTGLRDVLARLIFMRASCGVYSLRLEGGHGPMVAGRSRRRAHVCDVHLRLIGAAVRVRNRSNITRQILQPAIERANAELAKAGRRPIEGVTNHSLRRTFCALLYEAGATPAYVMAQMGHTDASLALEVYSKVWSGSATRGSGWTPSCAARTGRGKPRRSSLPPRRRPSRTEPHASPEHERDGAFGRRSRMRAS